MNNTDIAAQARIHTLVTGCDDCPSCVYSSAGRYSCERADYRKFDVDGKSSEPPEWCPLPLCVAVEASARKLAAPERTEQAAYEAVLADHARLVRELDVLLNGENAARQASLCDIVSQIAARPLTASPTAQPSVEPVGWLLRSGHGTHFKEGKDRPSELMHAGQYVWKPLYATPPPAPVLLSDAEIDKLYYEYSFNTDPNTPNIVWRRGFARAIEQAIGRASREASK